MNPKVSVIIPARNEEKTISLLLDAILQQTYPIADMEVIIADGLSTDATRMVISSFQKEHPELSLTVVDNVKQNIPSGLNAAMAAAAGDIFIRLDAHSIPRPDYITRCVDAHAQGLGENVGGVWDIRPQVDTWIARAIAAAAGHPLAVGDAQYRFTDKAAHVDTVPFGSFTRALIEKVGGFDETLLTNEDYELNVRIRQAGGRVWLDPAIRSTYFARKNLTELARQYWRYGFWKSQMLMRYPKTLRYRQVLPPLFVSGLIVLLLAGFFLRPAWWLLLGAVLVYIIILLLVGTQIAIKKQDALMVLGVPMAIATMQTTWGAGLLAGLFTRTRK